MQNLFVMVLLASELSYYLLIAQTGVVETFHSDLFRILPLPLGGILGSLIAHQTLGILRTLRGKLGLFLVLQLGISLAYPHYGPISLFLLGITVGALAPLLIRLFSTRDIWQLTAALGIAYAVGTSLFATAPETRRGIAIALSALALLMLALLHTQPGKRQAPVTRIPLPQFSLLLLWVTLDSSLFEFLSRSDTLSIWRGGLWPIIILFHLLGLATAYATKRRHDFHHGLIAMLFGASYGAYFLGSAPALAIVYPFAISYYSFFLMRALLGVRSTRSLGIYMVFAGWLASGLGLGVALSGLIGLPVALLLFASLWILAHKLLPYLLPYVERIPILRKIPFPPLLVNLGRAENE